MNTLKNAVQLIGRLGNDPEVRNFESGKNLTSFSLAVNESYTNKEGEKVEDTQWFNIVMWGKSAENAAKILRKGSETAVTGKLTNRSYEKDEETKYITEVQANEFLTFTPKSEDSE
mgnify:CR=1 FL=1|tara:strand:+ start:1856 stop:2203 length:348 start_codon:yes stop_codon:yes gene_type:complete